LAALIGTAQVPVPAHAPLQPANTEPLAGVAVKITLAPLANPYEHADPQLMPAGLLATVPAPDPALVTVKLYLALVVCGLNVAVTLFAAFMVTAQAAAPVHAPLQPAKVEPAAGTAVSVTLVPPA